MATKDERRKRRDSEETRRRRIMPYRKNRDNLVLFDRHKKPASLKETLRGCSMFLVCGGPSIKTIDYSRLSGRGIVSLGVNNVAGMVPVDYFVCSDPPEKFSHEIWFDPKITKLIPQKKARRGRLRIKQGGEFHSTPFRAKDVPNVFFFERREWFDPADFLTSEAATWGNNDAALKKGYKPKMLFTFFLGLRLCHYLGAENVFLLGVDFDMSPKDPTKPAYAFEQDKHSGGRRSNHGSYAKAIEWCRQLKPVFDEAGFNVYNCNPTSRLEVFDYCPFGQALDICRGPFVTGNADLKDWYLKVNENGETEDG